MASRAVDDCDGIFVEKETIDEVDSPIQISEKTNIPPRYILSSKEPEIWSEEAVSRPRMVHKDWGNLLTDVVESSGFLALISTGNTQLQEETAKKLADEVEDAGKEHNLKVLRWGTYHLLVYFPAVDNYRGFGHSLVTGTKKLYKEFSVISVQGAVLGNPPRMFMEMSQQNGQDIHRHMTEAILPFSSAFTFLEIFVEDQPLCSSALDIPSACLTMLFDGRYQSHAQRTQSCLSKLPWKRLTLSKEVEKGFDTTGISYFQNTLGGPLWAVKTGCPQAGVQLTVFVQNLAYFDQMVVFYQSILEVAPLAREVPKSDTRYRVFPLSSRAELMVAHFPGLHPVPSENITICVRVENLDMVKNAEVISEDRRKLRDPEGNLVCLFKPLK